MRAQLLCWMACLACSLAAGAVTVQVKDYTQRIIYHSPETPGYTSWVGLWQQGGALWCSFEQRTGPTTAPVSQTVVLRSADGGLMWQQRPEHLSGRGMVVLPDGALVAPRWGASEADIGWIARSADGGRSWQRVDFLPADRYRAWPTLIRPLRDGRLVMMAGVWRRGDGKVPNPRMTKQMFISSDGGRTWGKPITLMATAAGVCEESDFVELPSGDLFWVHRVEHFAHPYAADPMAVQHSDRMQSIVRKRGQGWQAEPAVPAPFPHSGYPCLLQAREGVILHLATDGIWWTADAGQHWEKLEVDGTGYYPKAEQLADGTIVCIGHVGADDVYGTVDQSITMQRFRLAVTR